MNRFFKNSISIAQFKNKLLSTVIPVGNSICNIHDIIYAGYSTKLRSQFRALKEHKVRYSFDCFSPVCMCGKAKDDNKHFLLHCPLCDIMPCDHLGQLSEAPALDISHYDSKSLCTLRLFGSPLLNVIANRIIMKATITFIKETKNGLTECSYHYL